jgi:hypothetical protein
MDRVGKHPGLGFTAFARVDVIVEARDDVVNREFGPKFLVHRLNDGNGLSPARDVGLIRHDNQNESGSSQLIYGVNDAIDETKLIDSARRYRNTINTNGFVKDTVTVEEHRSTYDSIHLLDLP